MALSRRELYVEAVYQAIIVRPLEGVAFLAKVCDGALSGTVRLIAALPGMVGQGFRVIHNGLVQFYALAMMLGLTVLVAFVLLRVAR
jgi:NADH:ubiquinone oxidoreductase subunit 5 (subunit L)/multisubunit Na+/H+ antiporter MnhA subunit